jgi:erythromycin esterase
LEEWQVNRQHVRHLEQIVDYAVAARTSDYDAFDIRDRAMADNIRWILDKEPPGTKVVYWAHNFHVGLTKYPGWSAKSMGMNMKRMLGSDYLSIGFVFNRGDFLSRDSTIDSWKTRGAQKRFTVESYPGSYGAAMARVGMPIFFLDLRSIPAAGVGEWFSTYHFLKSIDSVFAGEKDIRHTIRLPQLFDAVIFLETTTASRSFSATPLPVTLF